MANKKLDDMTKDELILFIKHLKENKKFGIVWENKPENIQIKCKTELPILEEVQDKAINYVEGELTNIIIEGDNYHSLSVLNYTHKNKIDVIYIDPPYNRGNNDFIYNDNYVDKQDTYRHSKWLSFMEKRLKLAKDLLRSDGVMFISIDDTEIAHLKLLCVDLFGEGNVEIYIWNVKDESEGALPKTAKYTVRKEHEYIIACFINKNKVKFNKYNEYTYIDKSDWGNTDNDPRGEWMSGNISRGGGNEGSNFFEIISPTGLSYKRNWSISYEEYQTLRADNRIFFARNGNGVPRLKIFKNEAQLVIQSSIFSNLKSSISGKNAIIELLGSCTFNHPKPVELIERLIYLASKDDGVVLDFFAGTGTTGHAVINLNDNGKSKRRFILCTNNENRIAEDICYPRITKVLENKENAGNSTYLSTNLKYYQTAFVTKSKVSDDVRFALIKRSVEMICLKENTFTSVESNNDYQIYRDTTHNTGILFNLDSIDNFKNKINSLNKPISIYIFSLTNDKFEEDFTDLSISHELCPIPESILEVYRKLFKD